MAARQDPRKIAPEERIRDFREVEGALSPQQAVTEASRCLFCHDAPCTRGCPAGVDVAGFIRRLKTQNFVGAARVIREANPLAAVCARVCPSSVQCEKECSSTDLSEPIAIRALQRFVCDVEMSRGIKLAAPPARTGRRIAVIGSGPAGLACAAELARKGHSIKVFEDRPSLGGAMRYAIPAYRLPKKVLDAEIRAIADLGVEFETGARVAEGAGMDIDRLLAEYDAVFMGVGLGKAGELRIKGEELPGVIDAYRFLEEAAGAVKEDGSVDHDAAPRAWDPVVVIGGGNVAIDAACTARRLGAKNVTIAYRRTQEEMPAWPDELKFAVEEGVGFEWLVSPIEITSADGQDSPGGSCGGGEGAHLSVRFARMKLGEPDGSGRRRPVPIEGEYWEARAGTVITALGQSAYDAGKVAEGLATDDRGFIIVHPDTYATSRKGVFAGGDAVNGGTTVARAVGEGVAAARAIHEYLEAL